MTSINNVDINDIKVLLNSNGIKVPSYASERYLYKVAETGILGSRFDNYQDVIIDWIIAKNLVDSKVNIKIYKLSEVNNLSDDQLGELYQELSGEGRMDDVISMEKSVINILKFSDKLQYDEAGLYSLPEDVFFEILRNSDLDVINRLCGISAGHKKYCEDNRLRGLLMNKFAGDDNLDVSKYSISQLIKYYEILPYKKKKNIFRGSDRKTEYYLNDKRNVVTFGANKINLGDHVNQVIQYSGSFAVALTVDGNLEIINLATGNISHGLMVINKETRKPVPMRLEMKFCAIFQSGFSFIALTSRFKFFYFLMEDRLKNFVNDIKMLPDDLDKIKLYSGKFKLKEWYMA